MFSCAEAQHEFTQAESDWGFTSFVQLEEVNNPANGFLVNDTLLLRVELTVLRDEKYNMDARKATGHVGLKNQGATCYMNSLLQYLYNLNYFRTVSDEWRTVGGGTGGFAGGRLT